MIYITGDCHAEWDKFSSYAFPEQKEMTRDDYVIVCGDFGIWHNTKSEMWWLDWLEEKSFTILFVDGNHENFDRLCSDEFPIVDFCGGKAHRIRENIYHLMRGEIFEICGKKIFAFGGASSHDIDDGILDRDDFESDEEFKKVYHRWRGGGKIFRVNHVSWWEQEMPNDEEMAYGLENLKKHDYKVDYIISHCAPQEIATLLSNGAYKSDKLTQYFNELKDKVQFQNWFFGHYHNDERILDKFILLYGQIVRVI